MLADLHTHNSVGSRDSRVSPAELVRNLKQRRIDALCVTDHDSYQAVKEIRKIGEQEGVLVIGGVELNTRYGHLLAYGVDVSEIVGARLRHRALDELSKQIASKDVNVHSLAGVFQDFYYKIFSEMDQVITMVHDGGGAVVLPHPFGGYDPTTTNLRYYLDRYLASLGAQTGPVKTDCLLAYVRQEDPSFFSMLHHIDGVEVLNPLCRGVENRAASVLADYLHKNEIGASDCHSPDEVGVCATALSDKIDSEEEFLRQIKRYGTTNAKVNLKKDEIWPWFGNEKQETFMLFHSL